MPVAASLARRVAAASIACDRGEVEATNAAIVRLDQRHFELVAQAHVDRQAIVDRQSSCTKMPVVDDRSS